MDFEVSPPRDKRKPSQIWSQIILPDQHKPTEDEKKITVERLVIKEVTEHEATILCRHGWKRQNEF